jgi:hypothetical protein
VVVKVDVGPFDRNVDLAQRYGVPLRKGIPTVASARSMSEDELVGFCERAF